MTICFELLTRPEDPSTRRSLLMDGHDSHIAASVTAFCMENAIDLLILLPRTSHLLRPLDVGVFAPLKRALASEAMRLDSHRISRVERTETYIRAREKALTTSDILSGWRGAELVPLSPVSVLKEVPAPQYTNDTTPYTPCYGLPNTRVSVSHVGWFS